MCVRVRERTSLFYVYTYYLTFSYVCVSVSSFDTNECCLLAVRVRVNMYINIYLFFCFGQQHATIYLWCCFQDGGKRNSTTL